MSVTVTVRVALAQEVTDPDEFTDPLRADGRRRLDSQNSIRTSGGTGSGTR
ncbi:hypothetical protein STENM327S_06747 [Streptomyces tendae]